MKLKTDFKPITLKLDDEGIIRKLKIYPPQSNEAFFAAPLLREFQQEQNKTQKMVLFGRYAGSLVAGWDCQDIEYFGESYSPDYAIFICSQITNSWLANAIIDCFNDSVKPLAGKNES